MVEVREYIHGNHSPYSAWLNSLDRTIKARVLTRIDRVRRGNFSDTKPVGAGVFELRLDIGPGYRVYFGRAGDTVVILLCGGDKSTQTRDIQRAKDLWQRHRHSAEN